jgi:hypothetical protein
MPYGTEPFSGALDRGIVYSRLNTHQKSGRQQLKPSWFHPGSEKEVFAAKKPKHYLAYTEVLERKLLYPRAVKVITGKKIPTPPDVYPGRV